MRAFVPYTYQALIRDIIDGDTLSVDISVGTLSNLPLLISYHESAKDKVETQQAIKQKPRLIDVGFSIYLPLRWAKDLAEAKEQFWLKTQKIRFYGINCPEKRTPAGITSRKFVEEYSPKGSIVYLTTFKVASATEREKYGRYLGVIRKTLDLNENPLNNMLVDKGLAVPYLI